MLLIMKDGILDTEVILINDRILPKATEEESTRNMRIYKLAWYDYSPA